MNSGKQSFYEIQLNNSSLIVAFLIAVALGVAVFMLGVRVGRGQAPQTPDESMWVESFPEGQDGQTASSEPTEQEGQGDLDFFEQVEEPVEGGTATPTPEAATGGDDASTAEPAASQPEATTPRQPAAVTTVPAPAGLPEGDLSLSSGWVVQVKATPREEEAYALQEALERAGFRTFVVQTESRGQVQYRVRVGRYRSKPDAEAVAAALAARADITDTWVTEG